MGTLTTHILDTAAGLPGMAIELHRVSQPAALLVTTRSDTDGRCPALLDAEQFVPGIYELRFDVAAYYREQGVALPDPPFLDIVTLRFGIADAAQHYHVPLLISPWSYSTYRGS